MQKEQTEKKQRSKKTIPNHIEGDNGVGIAIDTLTLAQLGEAQTSRKEWIADFDKAALDQAKLELKAINNEIKKRAK